MVGTGTAQSSTAISIRDLRLWHLSYFIYRQYKRFSNSSCQNVLYESMPCNQVLNILKNMPSSFTDSWGAECFGKKDLVFLQVMLRRNTWGRKTKTFQVLQGNMSTALNCLCSLTWQSQLQSMWQLPPRRSTWLEVWTMPPPAGYLPQAWMGLAVGQSKHVPPGNSYTLERAVLLWPNLLPESGWVLCILNCKYLEKLEVTCHSFFSFIYLWWNLKGKIHLMVNTRLWKIIP